MFRALLAHHQEALYKQHLVYYVRFISVGCIRIEVELACLLCQLAASGLKWNFNPDAAN
jgi:hypothetical protein